MIINKATIPLYYKRIIDDIAQRPYTSEEGWWKVRGASEKIENNVQDKVGNIEMLLQEIRNNPDYNQALHNGYSSVRPNKIGEPKKRLEDIDESWLRSYCEQIIYDIIQKRRGAFMTYNMHAAEVQAIFTDDETGGLITQGSLMARTYSNKKIFINNDKKLELIHILKELNRLSCIKGISLLSVIIANEKYIRTTKYKDSIPKAIDLLRNNIYLQSRDGKINSLPLEATTQKCFNAQTWAYRWICRIDNYEEYDLYVNLRSECSKLGIDLSKEDARDYDEEFFQNVTNLILDNVNDCEINNHKINRNNYIRLKNLSFKNDRIENDKGVYNIADKLVDKYLCTQNKEICKVKDRNMIKELMNLSRDLKSIKHDIYTEYDIPNLSEKRLKNNIFTDEAGNYLTYNLRYFNNNLRSNNNNNISIITADGIIFMYNNDLNRIDYCLCEDLQYYVNLLKSKSNIKIDNIWKDVRL